jgi:hypothetical protein
MPVKRRAAKSRLPPPISLASLTPAERAFLQDEPEPADASYGEWWGLHGSECWRGDKPDAAELWVACGADVLAQWAMDYPGTRPRLWWKYDAPDVRQDHESEASFLLRHALFLPGEAERLTAADYEPEAES